MKPRTMTRQVATVVGPCGEGHGQRVHRLRLALEALVDEEAGVVVGNAQRDPHDEDRRHVDRLAGRAEQRADHGDRQHVDERGTDGEPPVAQR